MISGTSLKQAYTPYGGPMASVSKVTSHSNYIETAGAGLLLEIELSQVRKRLVFAQLSSSEVVAK